MNAEIAMEPLSHNAVSADEAVAKQHPPHHPSAPTSFHNRCLILEPMLSTLAMKPLVAVLFVCQMLRPVLVKAVWIVLTFTKE